MCEVWEEIREEAKLAGIQEGRKEGIQEGRKEGIELGLQESRNIMGLRHVIALMKNLDVPLGKAMDLLSLNDQVREYVINNIRLTK